MRAGDRVRTPDGPGVVTSILTDEVWIQRRPTRTVYAIVQLDDETYRAMYPPSELQEEPMNETTENPMGGVLIQPIEGQTTIVDETTTEEPEPQPEPEPDPEPEDEDGDNDQ